MKYVKTLLESSLPSNHNHSLQIIPTRGSTTPLKMNGFTPYGHEAIPVMGRPKFNDYLKARMNYMQIDRQVT